MNSVNKFLDENGTWVFLAPISNLILTKAINYEFRVDHVTFIESTKLSRVRKKFSIPHKISHIRSKNLFVDDEYFASTKVFATMRCTGLGTEVVEKFLDRVRDELAILALSQLGFSRRKNNATPFISGEGLTNNLQYCLFNLSSDSIFSSSDKTYKMQDLVLDENWLKWSKRFIFYPLLRIIRGDTGISKSWRKNIINAAILAGKSQYTTEKAKCFLWNVIVLETLLTVQGDVYRDKLPKRVEAFLGWIDNWQTENFPKRIQDVYTKRCSFVHTGDSSLITIEDILFTDDLILNVLYNIVQHSKFFMSKDDLIKFSEKIEAEKTLGIKSKIRPRTLASLIPVYRDDDYRKL